MDFSPKMNVTIARQNNGTNRNARCLLIDKCGQQVGQEFFEDGRAGGEGLLAVMRGGMFGCVDESAQVVIPFSFKDMSYFSEGLASARVADEKVGAIDTNAHWAIQPVFVYLGQFCAGLAAAQIKDMGVYKWGYVDRDGDWVIEPQFEEAYDFVDGVAGVIPLGVNPDEVEQMGYIDTKGEYIWELSKAEAL